MLVNELGQRVFDTQVRLVNPSPSSNRQQAQFLMKQGQSMSPPSVELVRAIILHLIAGRRLIGYHVTQKLKELQIVGEMTGMTQAW